MLAVAFHEADASHTKAVLADEASLTFSGFLAFIDPPKASAAAAIRCLSASGVAVKVISGDNERVTRHVCSMIGFDTGAFRPRGRYACFLPRDAAAEKPDHHGAQA